MKLFTATLLLALALTPLAAADLPRAAGELQITTQTGAELSLDDLAGKPVLVMYFSTDCPHCQNTARLLAPIYEEYKAKGVEFVGVAMNPTAPSNLGLFVERFSVEFPVGLGDRDHFVAFSGVTDRFYFPYLLFVDKEGKIQEEHQGADRGYFADLNGAIRGSLDKLLGGS